MGQLGPRMAHLYNSGSAVRTVLQFWKMKGDKRDMEIILMVLLKKNLIQGNLVILAQKWYVLITLDLLSRFFQYCTIKEAKRYMKILLKMFFEKKIHLGEFTRFRSFFTVCKGVINIKPGYCYYWIF